MKNASIDIVRQETTGGIRSLRTAAKLKLSGLAASASIPLERLKRIERGLAELDDVTARALARAMHTEPEAVSAAHATFLGLATPGEGYTTSRRGNLDMTADRHRQAQCDRAAGVSSLCP